MYLERNIEVSILKRDKKRPEVGIYERKQESKKTRRQELDQKSDQNTTRKKERKHAVDQESDQEKKKKLSFLIDRFLGRVLVFIY